MTGIIYSGPAAGDLAPYIGELMLFILPFFFTAGASKLGAVRGGASELGAIRGRL